MTIVDELRKHKRGSMLKLSAKNHNDLLDFLSCFQLILLRSASREAVGAGFVDSGMIDSKSFSYLELHTIIGTCKTVKYIAKIERIVSSYFVKLYEEQLRDDRLTDTFMKKSVFGSIQIMKVNV